MNLATILLLLQAVLAMLSNPAIANNPQTRTLAQQAVIVATQALENQTTALGTAAPNQSTSITFTPQNSIIIPAQPGIKVTYNPPVPVGIGAPDLGSVSTTPTAAAPAPSCTVTATGRWNSEKDRLSGNYEPIVSVSWTAQNVTLPGSLQDNYDGEVDGGVVQFRNIASINSLTGPGPGTKSLSWATVYKLIFREVTCYAYYRDSEATSSVPDRPSEFNQLTL